MKRSYTILYVEDDHDDLLIISEAFEKYTDHLIVVHAPHGREAMHILKSMSLNNKLPCLIILDINMPVMDGKETLSEIRKNKDYDNIPIVIFSTSRHLPDKEFAENLDATFISKPVQYLDMENLVKEFVAKCRLGTVTGA